MYGDFIQDNTDPRTVLLQHAVAQPVVAKCHTHRFSLHLAPRAISFINNSVEDFCRNRFLILRSRFGVLGCQLSNTHQYVAVSTVCVFRVAAIALWWIASTRPIVPRGVAYYLGRDVALMWRSFVFWRGAGGGELRAAEKPSVRVLLIVL